MDKHCIMKTTSSFHGLLFSHLYEHGRHERGHVSRQPERHVLRLLQQPGVGVPEKSKMLMSTKNCVYILCIAISKVVD